MRLRRKQRVRQLHLPCGPPPWTSSRSRGGPQFAHDPDVIANPRIAIAGVTPEAAGVYLSCTKGLPNVVRRSRPVAGGASGDCSEFSYVHPRLTRTC